MDKGWTGKDGINGKFYFLTVSMVNDDFRLPLISILSTVLEKMSGEITSLLEVLKRNFNNIYLVLFYRWFYTKELMFSLNSMVNYLIFVRKNSEIRRELASMEMGEKKIKLYEFTYYRDGKKISDVTHIAFLRKIFDHRTEKYYDWAFATNLNDVNLDEIVGKYKIRWG